MVPYPKVVGDCTSTRLPRSPPLFLICVPYVASCGSLMLPRSGQGGESVTHLVPALHPTGSHCAESSVPFHSLCGTGFFLVLILNLKPSSCSVSALIILLFFFCRQIYLVGELHGPRGQVTAPYATVVIFAATTHR